MKEIISTTAAPVPIGAYSQGVVANGFLFTAGFGPLDPQTFTIPEGIEAQTRQVLDNIDAVLAARDLDRSDVVKVNVHLADLATCFVGFEQVYATYYPHDQPVRTTVGSSLPGILVEVEVVAALRQ